MASGAEHGTRPLEIRGSMAKKFSPQERMKDHVEPCSHTFSSFSPHGLIRVKRERPSVSPPAFTTITHQHPLLERFLRWPRVVLLRIGGNCSLFASKPAHISGHLPGVAIRELTGETVLAMDGLRCKIVGPIECDQQLIPKDAKGVQHPVLFKALEDLNE